MRSKSLPLMASAAALLVAGSAAAQMAADPNKAPWDVTSDHLNGNDNECIAIWTGNAEALQVDRRLKADVLTAHFDNKNGPPPAAIWSGSRPPGTSTM
jgi:lipopolysaccharide export system protein LptA